MRQNRRARTVPIVISLLSAALLFGAVPPAQASPLDDAKAAGQIGERPDGYLGLVDRGAPAAVKALVEDINAKRRAAYREIAGENEVELAAVAARAGAKLIERAAPGEYVMRVDGTWVKK